jgi:hypothetical protein
MTCPRAMGPMVYAEMAVLRAKALKAEPMSVFGLNSCKNLAVLAEIRAGIMCVGGEYSVFMRAQ